MNEWMKQNGKVMLRFWAIRKIDFSKTKYLFTLVKWVRWYVYFWPKITLIWLDVNRSSFSMICANVFCDIDLCPLSFRSKIYFTNYSCKEQRRHKIRNFLRRSEWTNVAVCDNIAKYAFSLVKYIRHNEPTIISVLVGLNLSTLNEICAKMIFKFFLLSDLDFWPFDPSYSRVHRHVSTKFEVSIRLSDFE